MILMCSYFFLVFPRLLVGFSSISLVENEKIPVIPSGDAAWLSACAPIEKNAAAIANTRLLNLWFIFRSSVYLKPMIETSGFFVRAAMFRFRLPKWIFYNTTARFWTASSACVTPSFPKKPIEDGLPARIDDSTAHIQPAFQLTQFFGLGDRMAPWKGWKVSAGGCSGPLDPFQGDILNVRLEGAQSNATIRCGF